MITKFDQFTSATKASVDTVFGQSAQAFEAMEQLTALNLQTMKTLLAESQETSQVALLAKNPADLLKFQAEALQAAPQKAAAYGRQAQAIFAPLAAAQRVAFDAQIAEVRTRFLNAVNGSMKGAPGAENFLALAKSAAAVATSAFDGANKATQQASDAVKTSQGAPLTIEA